MNTTFPYPYSTNSPFTPGFNPSYFPGFIPGAFNQYPPYNAFPGANNNAPWNNTPWNNAYPTSPASIPGAYWNSTPWGNWGFNPIAQNNAWNAFNPWAYASQNMAPGAFNAFGAPPYAAAYTGNTGSTVAPWFANGFNQNNAGIPGAYPFNAAFYGSNAPNRVNGTHGINGVQQPVREAA